ncbi:MAG: ATP-binding cassette domain-containing protein [Sneathiellaceae bacterium]
MTGEDAAPAPLSGLFARGVTVRFEGVTALEDVDLALEPGEILGLIGPNGAGKTTLVNVLTGFQKPGAGTVGIDGEAFSGRPPHDFARAGLGRTFQAVRLFAGMTVLENVELGAVGKGIARAAARAEAAEILDWLGLGAMAGLQAGTLPYGDERWVGLARALAGRPRFLLLDEPAAGLNEAEAERLVTMVARIRDRFGCGVLIIEHNMKLVMSLCDRIHVLEHGRTIATGTPAEAQADPEVRRAYLGGQDATKPAVGGGHGRATGFDAGTTLLEVESLQVNYGPVEALRGVSLAVAEGELVRVIGPNGAGKSTLMLAISGMVPASGGHIRYAGSDLAGQPAERIVRDGISMVPEGRHVFPALTVEENLLTGATPARGRAGHDRATAARDLEEVLQTFPILRDRFRSAAGKLSGGEQQQLVIARALLAKPRLLLLDEPSLGLAPLVIDLLFGILARMRDAGQTILLVEQNAARALEVADRTYVLRSGAIMLAGPSAALAADPRFDEAYFGFAGAGAGGGTGGTGGPGEARP